MTNKQQLLLTLMAEHVSEKFNIGEDYQVTRFNAKQGSITLSNPHHDIAITVKGEEMRLILDKLEDKLQELKEADEEVVEE